MNLFDWDKPALKITKPVRLIELFAGIGAQAKALERLGVPFEHHKVVEIDRFAVASYNAIHGTDFKPMDITKITAADLNITETNKWCYILTYSFPCQDLSKAGASKGLGKGTRSGLLWEVDRILHECKELPQILLMENVSMIVSDKHINDFAVWVKRLEELGYTNLWEIMNAKNFGVPQNRERCFMVSFLGDYQFEFPKPIPLTRTMGDTLEPDVDEKYYLNEETANNLCSQLVKVERERESKPQHPVRRTEHKGRKAYMGYSMCRKFIGKPLKCSYGILARYYKGLSKKELDNGVIEYESDHNKPSCELEKHI